MATVVADTPDSCRKLDGCQLLPQLRAWSRAGDDGEFGPSADQCSAADKMYRLSNCDAERRSGPLGWAT